MAVPLASPPPRVDKSKFKKKDALLSKSLPQGTTVNDLFNSLPKEVFTQDRFKAYGSLFATVAFITLSVWLTSRLPWYLLPIGWLLVGASVTGLFAIGHDCVNSSFAKSKLVNDIVGTIAMLPLGYSFQSWKTQHKYKVTKTAPVHPTPKPAAFLYEEAKGYTFWLRSIGLWASQHCDISLYRSEDQVRVRIGLYLVGAFGAVFFSAMWMYVGVQGIINYWLLPWCVYHFLMSTTNMLPSIMSLDEGRDNLWVHCEYPQWLEYLTHDISIALPRQISSSIPHYNLRKAYRSLKQNWGDYITEVKADMSHIGELVAKANQINPATFAPFVYASPFATPFNAEGDLNPVQPESAGFSTFLSNVLTFVSEVNWLHFSILIPTPIIAVYGLLYVRPAFVTLVFAFIYYVLSGLGITAGYHRLWSHKAYSARTPLKVGLLLFGSGAVEGSIRWWCRDHRAHHRYTDSDQDPYSAQKGFIFSHIGWMLMKQKPENIGKASIEDLNADPWIRWQHRNYLALAIGMGFVVPALIPALWGDLSGGFFYASILRLVLVHHATFCVNSLAHYWGDISYADHHTPRDSVITALLTFGEGYHNFHHEFPHDYRNAVLFFQYDPTKWFIKMMHLCGQAYNLKTFSDNEVEKGKVQMAQKMLDRNKKSIDWGLPVSELPVYTKASLQEAVAQGQKLVVIEGVVHDLAAFVEDHPGGKSLIEANIGRDATNAFNGAVYEHSNGARNLLSQMRVGRADPAEFPFKRSPLSWEHYTEQMHAENLALKKDA